MANAGMKGDVGNYKTPQQIAAQIRLQHTNAQVDEVVGIMGKNVDSMIQRDGKLSELHERADALEEGASRFELQARDLKRKACMKNKKMMVVMGVIGFICLLFIGYKLGLF